MAQMLGSDYDDGDHLVMKPNNYKALYMVGLFLKPDNIKNLHVNVLGKFKDKKIIIHYIGSDIYWLRKFTTEELRLVSGVLNKSAASILCETRWDQTELAEYGVKADIVPIPPYTQLEPKPLPDKFSVAIFLTDKSDYDKYCLDETLSIVRSLPHVKFNAYGDGGRDVRLPNFEHFGNMETKEWEEFVYNNSCLLRIARHDTRPMATDEFLLAGRDVVTNIPGVGVRYVSTAGDPDRLEYDKFEVGLNDTYWPKTKKAIIQEILNVRNNGRDEKERMEIHDIIAKTLSRDKFRESIWSIVNKEDKKLELVGGK
jgi:hypothetical protein